MTRLEEINETEDKDVRLRLLQEYIAERLKTQSNTDNAANDDEISRSRDYAGGMMSKFGKPGD